MTTTDWTNVEQAAQELAGNWKEFESFSWHDRPDDGERWAIIYTHNRDSGLRAQSNASAIAKALARFTEATEADEPDVIAERHGHWACGWVDGYAIRVFRPDWSITDAFRAVCELQAALEDYPVLDDEDYSRREYEAALDGIRDVARRLIRDGAPDGWESDVYSYLSDYHERELENWDDNGAYPSEDSVREALAYHRLLDLTDADRVYYHHPYRGYVLVWEGTAIPDTTHGTVHDARVATIADLLTSVESDWVSDTFLARCEEIPAREVPDEWRIVLG